MNYELAKQLKDAGFPQTSHIILCGQHPVGNCNEFEDECHKTHVCIPTLSEIVEACGELVLVVNEDSIALADRDDIGYRGNGSTPEEAVSRLWLELNKK